MIIPKIIKILGHNYNIKWSKDRCKETGSANPGTSWAKNTTIWIDGSWSQPQQEASLIHEIIECLNYHLEMDLEHRKIQSLEAGIYQVLKDNKLIN